MNSNQLTVTIYEGISDTERADPSDDLINATVERFDTFFPGGLYGPASIFIPRDVTAPFLWTGGDRFVIRNGLEIVWEGEVNSIGYAILDNVQGIRISGIGFYGRLLSGTTVDKRWADDRIDGDVWVTDKTALGADGATEDRQNRIQITPKEGTVWRSGVGYHIDYTMPVGETIKRVVMNYSHAEDGEIGATFAKWNNAPGGANTFTDMDNALDRDAGTNYALTLTSDDYIYVGFKTLILNRIRVDMGATVNAVAATLSAEYYAAADDTTAAGWASLSITDGTASGGATLAQDGDISFTRPDDMQRTSVDSDNAYWIRLQASANLTASINIVEIGISQLINSSTRLRDKVGATSIWNVTAEGTGSQDVTLGTPRQNLTFVYQSGTNNAEYRGDGSYHGQISGVMMYSETGSINLTEIAKDLRAAVSNLNSYEGLIDSNSLTLEPFYTVGPESVASILTRAASFGDASFNSWYARLVDSEQAETPDGKPVLEVKQWPVLTDHEYEISVDQDILVNSIEFVEDYAVVNYVTVAYQDDTGRDVIITPDDDSALKDDDSIALYGERHSGLISVRTADDTLAKNIGKTYLAANKDPKFYVSSPISVIDLITTKQGNTVSSSEIQAGQRVKITSFLDDLVQVITDTSYDDSTGICTFNLQGVPDSLPIILAQQRL